jgi:hypothetical protein
MTTPRQRASNREHAKKSTGPITAAGKSVTRLNALKHGLLSREVLLQGENETTLIELGKRMRAHL